MFRWHDVFEYLANFMWHQRDEIVSIAFLYEIGTKSKFSAIALPLDCDVLMPNNKSGVEDNVDAVQENEIIGQFQFESRILLSSLSKQ